MTGWEDELLRFLTNDAGGMLLYICAAVAGIFAVEYQATQRAWSEEPLHPPITSPLQKVDALLCLAALLPLACGYLVRFEAESPGLVLGPSIYRATAICVVLAVATAFWRTTMPVFVAVILLLSSLRGIGVDIWKARPVQSRRHERIRISAAGDIPNVDLWLNNERIGSLPLECNTAELAAQMSPFQSDMQKMDGYGRQLHDAEYRCLRHWYASPRHRGYEPPWHVFYLKFASAGGRNDYQSLTARLGATVRGAQAFPKWTIGDDEAGEAVSFTDSDGTDHVVLGIRMIEWEHDLARLADIARAGNYEVNKEWCDAALTYEPRAWYYFRELVPFEAEFRGILDQIADRAYRIDEIETMDAAWTVLIRISNYFIDRGHFDSRSLQAKAFEYVAGKVSPRRLTARCGELLSDHQRRLISYIARSRGVTWLTATDEFSTFRPVRQTVFGYAAWCLDRALDKQHPDHENALEKWLTPRLLRHRDLQSARIIGGPAWQAFSEANPDAGRDDLKQFPDLSGIGYMHRPVRGFAFRSASEFLERREKEFQKNGPQHLREMMAHDRYHDEAVELVAKHTNVEFRSAALLAIRFHPTPERRKLLDLLEDDEDQRIRSEVTECREYLRELRSSPYPHRQMPQPPEESSTALTRPATHHKLKQ